MIPLTTLFLRESVPASGCPVSRKRGVGSVRKSTNAGRIIDRIDFCDEINGGDSKGLQEDGSVLCIRSAFFADLRSERSKSATPVCKPVITVHKVVDDGERPGRLMAVL